MELKNSKLIQLLKTFSENEIKRLENYVTSPFFNKIDPGNLNIRQLSSISGYSNFAEIA